MMYFIALILAFIPFNHAGDRDCPCIFSETGCPPGVAECDQCWSHDDPHILTFDGVAYDQHTDGCFQYVTTCTDAADNLPFELCGCHYDCGYGNHGDNNNQCPSNIRCIGNITLTFFDSSGTTTYELRVDVNNPTLNAFDLISSTSLPTGTYTFDILNGHTFLYTKTSSHHDFDIVSGPSSGVTFYAHVSYTPGVLDVWVNDAFFSGNTCGLCGYYTGITSDDFLGTDGTTLHVDPDNISYPISTAVNAQINTFANDYLCDPLAPNPTDPGCEPLDPDCIAKAVTCCRSLWKYIFDSDATDHTWDNDVINQAIFWRNWVDGCAQDACALAGNNFDCDNPGNALDFAKHVALTTATAVYTVQTPTVEPDFESNCTAKICAHGDNKIGLDVSYDSGSTWDLTVASENNWKHTMTAVINPVDADTILRFTVKDEGDIGGFLATVQLCGTNGYVFPYYTDETNTYFDVLSDSTGDELLDVFYAFGDGPWGKFVNEEDVLCMHEKADWMWNDKTYNTMVFELDFGHHLDILRRLDCVEEDIDTPAPTVDCCSVFSLDEYLDTCYCGEDTTVDTEQNTGVMAGAKSIGMNEIDVVKTVDGAFYNKMSAEMNEIKNMIYGTWALVCGCFVVHILLVNDWCGMKRIKFKVVEDGSDGV
eukprot:319796_1